MCAGRIGDEFCSSVSMEYLTSCSLHSILLLKRTHSALHQVCVKGFEITHIRYTYSTALKHFLQLSQESAVRYSCSLNPRLSVNFPTALPLQRNRVVVLQARPFTKGYARTSIAFGKGSGLRESPIFCKEADKFAQCKFSHSYLTLSLSWN